MEATNETLPVKKIALKHKIILGLFCIAGIGMWAESAYHKKAIEGHWLCSRADGSTAGAFQFDSDGNFLETDSRTEQFFGDYSVKGSTITTKIVGSTTHNISYNESNPLITTFDFIEKKGDRLLLKAWPINKPMGVALSCVPFNS
ncbi:hypothetical protein [Pseudoduganella namucuonensis]|uniref:hypothetical protein n=1 Tax=Pseudoduganella namucuonensis TaxID=1035707 RepID=UPI0011604880|nr:hypothetical protein [Pseudoduganella namucuonensis]